MITIKNLRKQKPKKEWQVKVDRSSVLGNPYLMELMVEEERQEVCDKYEEYFKIFTRKDNLDSFFLKELNRLKQLHKKYGKLELFCWCAPKRCHAETIKKYLEKE